VSVASFIDARRTIAVSAISATSPSSRSPAMLAERLENTVGAEIQFER
jgi:hypothetical protein